MQYQTYYHLLEGGSKMLDRSSLAIHHTHMHTHMHTHTHTQGKGNPWLQRALVTSPLTRA